jgi:hypothetical protein
MSLAIGLASLVLIPGCGWLPLYREQPSNPPASIAAKQSSTPFAKAEIAQTPKVNDLPWPTAPAVPYPTATVPVVEPPRRIELSAQSTIEYPPVEAARIPENPKKTESVCEVPSVTVEKPKSKDSTPETVKVSEGGGEKSKIQVGETDRNKCFTGVVQQFRNTWRLRYAPADQDDPYGGSVVLEGAGVENLRDGQRVQVRGTLIPPTSRTSPARFRVESIQE